jgi:hypothetical protein
MSKDVMVSKSLIVFSDAMKANSNDHAVRVTSWRHYVNDGRGFANHRGYKGITPSSINRLHRLMQRSEFDPSIQIIDGSSGDQFIAIQVTSDKRSLT